MKKPQFVVENFYHVFNRGVEKRVIFLDEKDNRRFIYDLWEFNDLNASINTSYRINIEVEPRYLSQVRNPLVKILAFTLMPNHFHLLLQPLQKEGIPKFMQKLGTGYTMYFNKKYERVGSLFQGRFKAVHILHESHLFHIPHYIHLNPLDLLPPTTTKTPIAPTKALEFLTYYRWSSLPDYLGHKNFSDVTSREFILEMFGGSAAYQKALIAWLHEREKNTAALRGLTID